MPELPRNLPHFYLQNVGQAEPYTTRQRAQTPPPPPREREAHARRLEEALNRAVAGARARADVRPAREAASGGFYLQFEIPAGNGAFLQKLENRRKGIELVSVRQINDDAPAFAAVFVPFRAAAHFQRLLEEYRTLQTESGRPRHETLVNRINSISLAAIRSLFTDDEDALPPENEPTWWEIWVRTDFAEQFRVIAQNLEVHLVQDQVLEFPEREVFIARSTLEALGRLLARTDALAEIRLARDTPGTFIKMSNVEQIGWARSLVERLVRPPNDAVAVCVLDSGVTHTHPLLAIALDERDLHAYDALWGTEDSPAWRGHGTEMAGIALFGDLYPLILNNGQLRLTHRLESVKMLDPTEIQHDPKLYGYVTSECISRAEISAPIRSRAICMAVTSNLDVRQGRPSSWSAAIDRICYGDEARRRLLFVSAGNVKLERIPTANYLDRNDVEPILNPAQAWDAVTVGAYTEKTEIRDRGFRNWRPLADRGDLAPTSRTSLTWERQWPIKPDIVCEGGNLATDGNTVDCPDDLGLLSTYFQPQFRQFCISGDTSAATALAANMAGNILASNSRLWPETVRGLIVHSAEWTQRMRHHLPHVPTRSQKAAFLRRYGYGVPNLSRAVSSSLNDATLVVQDSLQAFWRAPEGTIKTRHMHLHRLPWPRAQLDALAETDVELRLTLSYFIEPNPGERGWARRHRYASHGLRFAVKKSTESLSEFRTRINRAVESEEQGVQADLGPDNWFLGPIRDVGSIHSDYWTGTAAELRNRDAIAIYPIGGWWKEKGQLHRYDQLARYSLILSLRATAGNIDIYTPIQTSIAAVVEIDR